MHYQDHDRLIVAWLSGASSRHADWTMPEGEALAAAIAELKEIATVGRTLRTDLLAEWAGICLGTADADDILGPHRRIQADLLIAAGAGPPELIEQWREIGKVRAERAEPASVRRDPPPGGWKRPKGV